jgi:hypothetical protein
MLILALDCSEVHIGARPRNKSDAIRQVGALLVESGHIEPGYVANMLARERVADTFLDNDIAIPHGIPKDRGMIRKTGVAVLQVADDFTPPDTAQLDPRSLDIPGVVGAGASILDLADDTPRILDGESGLLVARPSAADPAAEGTIRGKLLIERTRKSFARCYRHPALISPYSCCRAENATTVARNCQRDRSVAGVGVR